MPLTCVSPTPTGEQPAISAAAWAALGALAAASLAELLPVADRMLGAAGHLVTGCTPPRTTGGSTPQHGSPPKPSPPPAAAAAAVKAVAQLLAAVAQCSAAGGGGADGIAGSGDVPTAAAGSPVSVRPISPAAGAATGQDTGAAAAALPLPDALADAQAAALWLQAADRVLLPVGAPVQYPRVSSVPSTISIWRSILIN